MAAILEFCIFEICEMYMLTLCNKHKAAVRERQMKNYEYGDRYLPILIAGLVGGEGVFTPEPASKQALGFP